MDRMPENCTVHMFLSYSWNDSDLANTIDNELSSLGVDIKRDIRDIGTWTSIKEFMSTIKNQDYVVIIVSQSYLKSPNCMYEVMELFKDSHYKDKILSIVTSDADIYNPISRANYISYWEEETKKLEKAIKPLKIENTAELIIELRKYKSIEATIASFLDIVSDKNNPKIIDAVEKIKEIVCANRLIHFTTMSDNKQKNIEIKVEACHYAFLKFAALSDVSGTGLEKMIGIKKLNDSTKQDVYDLPMLQCEIINCSEQERIICEPMIEGTIKLKNTEVDAIGFMIKSQSEKRLKPGAKACFTLHGSVIICIIKALFESKIKNIYVEDNFGFRYVADWNQIEEITNYFKKYCSDLTELQLKHDEYCI